MPSLKRRELTLNTIYSILDFGNNICVKNTDSTADYRDTPNAPMVQKGKEVSD